MALAVTHAHALDNTIKKQVPYEALWLVTPTRTQTHSNAPKNVDSRSMHWFENSHSIG